MLVFEIWQTLVYHHKDKIEYQMKREIPLFVYTNNVSVLATNVTHFLISTQRWLVDLTNM